jgi:hypothetical protein
VSCSIHTRFGSIVFWPSSISRFGEMATTRKLAQGIVRAIRWLWDWIATWSWETICSVGWGIMLGSGEYLLSLIFLGLATLVAISLVDHWEPSDRKHSRYTRGATVLFIFAACGLMTLVTLANKGDKSWSHIPDYLASLVPLPSPPYPADRPEFSQSYLIPRPSNVKIALTDPAIMAALQKELDEQKQGKLATPRSYLVFNGEPEFPFLPVRNFLVGEMLGFNVRYKATGPNQIEEGESRRWLYMAADYKHETQLAFISDFKKKLNETPCTRGGINDDARRRSVRYRLRLGREKPSSSNSKRSG